MTLRSALIVVLAAALGCDAPEPSVAEAVQSPAAVQKAEFPECAPALELVAQIDSHHDPTALLGAGPSVVSEARSLDKINVALLGRYFRNGENGPA